MLSVDLSLKSVGGQPARVRKDAASSGGRQREWIKVGLDMEYTLTVNLKRSVKPRRRGEDGETVSGSANRAFAPK